MSALTRPSVEAISGFCFSGFSLQRKPIGHCYQCAEKYHVAQGFATTCAIVKAASERRNRTRPKSGGNAYQQAKQPILVAGRLAGSEPDGANVFPLNQCSVS